MMRGGDRILLATESLDPGNGGICRVARLMAKVISEEVGAGRVSGDAIALSDSYTTDEFAFGVRTAAKSRLKYFIEIQKASLSHTHLLFDFEGMARARGRIYPFRRPWMTWIHGIEVWEGAEPKRRRTARQADFLLSNTAYTRDRAQRVHGGFSHARVCWLATESDDVPPPVGPGDGPPTLLILGRMDRYKGHEQLIQGWARVVSAVPEAQLLIVGRGPNLELFKSMAGQSAAASAIEVAGFVPEEQMPAIWSRATAFAMPSRGEGFGLVYIEAMQHGLPVIASVHDAAPEVNLDRMTGFNVDMDKPYELTDRVIELLKDRDQAARMGAAGQQRWKDHFCYSAFRQRFRPLLNEFLRM